jgi:hypothetical protein
MKTRREKVVDILRQELGAVGDKAERTASMIINVLEYKKRSLKENRYYWKIIINMTAEYFGDDPQSMHRSWADMFLREERPGKPARIRSTADESFTTRDAEIYYEQIRCYMAREHGFIIPLPKQLEK